MPGKSTTTRSIPSRRDRHHSLAFAFAYLLILAASLPANTAGPSIIHHRASGGAHVRSLISSSGQLSAS
nr:unnamed protein product [Digitaria exilis]